MMDDNQDDELVGEEEESKNWKGMVLSLIVIVAIFLMVIIAIFANRKDIVETDQTLLTLDDILQNFEPKRFQGHWLDNNRFAFKTDSNDIRIFNCVGLNSTMLMPNQMIEPLVGDSFDFKMTSDPNVILFSYDLATLNRHSYTARYKLYNTKSNMEFDVMRPGAFENVPLQNVLLSPDGRKVAFVERNNIFMMTKFFDGQKDASQVTTDGEPNKIYNGITDWLYEEEILQVINAMYWSSNSRFLAYIRFDDSEVEEFSVPVYDDTPYTFMNIIRYPKVDSTNPTAEVFVYDTEKKATIKQQIPEMVSHGFGDYYILNVAFFSDSEILIVYLNREQNKAITVITDILTGTVNNLKEYPPQTGPAWNLPKNLAVSEAYNFYFQIWTIDKYDNIIAFNKNNGNVKQVTSHDFDVTDILFVNEKLGKIFYVATNGDPKQRHVFSVMFTDLNGKTECLTCDHVKNVTNEYVDPAKNLKLFWGSEKCLYHSASFSANGDYYALECLGDRVPITYIKSTLDEKLKFVYEKNIKLWKLVLSKHLPQKSYLTVELDAKTGETADAELYYPLNFNPVNTMYPVLIFTYGSPSSQLVTYQFNLKKFEAYIATNFNVIVASIDGRGTEANGEKFKKSVYKQLGKLEMHDQFKLAEALQGELYTDDSKFAIWGWSYGGYVSALALLNETSPFQCGVSGAPVTDWQFYDTAYTERYMGSYKENRKAYDESSLLEFARKNAQFLAKRSMLLVHGTADDNVHFQNSAVLANQLRRTHLDLDFEVYPNDRHTPNQETQRVFFKKLSKFLLNCYSIDWRDHLEALNLRHLIEIPEPPPA